MLMALRKSGWQGRVRGTPGDLAQTLRIKVWPSDMDIFMHMTNTRYFDVMKIATNILLARNGIDGVLRKEGLDLNQVYSDLDVYSMLRLFQDYTLETEIAGADDGTLAIAHTFSRGKKTNARGLVLYTVKDHQDADIAAKRTRFLPESVPPLPEDCKDWMGRDRLNPPL